MNADSDAAVLAYVENAVLNEGEEIVWRGRPSPAASAKIQLSRTVSGVVFVIVGGAWTILLINIQLLMAIPGMVGLIFGAKLSGHALVNCLKAGRTYYAVTNKRVLIITAGRSISVGSVTGAEIKKLRRVEKPDGTGSVSYRSTAKVGRDHNDYVRTYTTVGFKDGLWGVADVAGAARAIGALQPAPEDVRPDGQPE